MAEYGLTNTSDGRTPKTAQEMEDAKLRYAKNRSNEARDFAQKGKGYDPSLPSQLENYEFTGVEVSPNAQSSPEYLPELDKALHKRALEIITKKLPSGVERSQDSDYPQALEQAKQEMRQQFSTRTHKDPFPKKKEEPKKPKAPDDDKVKRPKY